MMEERIENECRQAEIALHDVDENAVDTCIEFCYTGVVQVDEANVQTLLPAACLFQLEEVQFH